MGLKITKNDEGYRLISTTDDNALHEAQAVSKDEAKVILMNRALFRFLQELVEIDDFPSGHMVNGSYHYEGSAGRWLLGNIYGEGGFERLMDKAEEVGQRVGFEFKIEERETS